MNANTVRRVGAPFTSALTFDTTKSRPDVRVSAGWVLRVLVVEDDPASAGGAVQLLRERGFAVTVASTVAEALRVLARRSFHAMLVDTSGGEHRIARLSLAIRRQSEIPLCIVSPTADEQETVIALELGADAVVRKPVRPDELTARLVTLIRRAGPIGPSPDIVRCEEIEVDPSRVEVRIDGELVDVSYRECMLLVLLLQHPDRALTREYLAEQLWGTGSAAHFKSLSGHVQRLRELIHDDSTAPTRLLTIRGYGYRFLRSSSPTVTVRSLDGVM